jgi:hypothetical protein
MYISKATHFNADKIERTVATVEAFTEYERKDKKSTDSIKSGYMLEDKFDNSAQTIEHYNNYTKSGAIIANSTVQQTSQVVTFVADTINNSNNVNKSQNSTPDITAPRQWRDPQHQKNIDIIENIFRGLAAESKRMNPSNPINHAWRRYHDPSAPHFIPGLSDFERRTLLDAERDMIRNGRVRDATAIAAFEWMGENGYAYPFRIPGRTIDIRKVNMFHENAISGHLARRSMNMQLSDLFRRSGINIPENIRLSFVIDTQYRLHVTGTDDARLIAQIEQLLNSNGNSAQLFRHILDSTRNHEGERVSSQVRGDSLRMYCIDRAIRRYTDYTRHDLDLVDGRFLTRDGVDIMDHIRQGILEEFRGADPRYIGLLISYNLSELQWLAGVGPENIPELILTIDFENGNLLDVGQPRGYGAGQIDWIFDLLRDYDSDLVNSWLSQ